jgi:hypothetical protein
MRNWFELAVKTCRWTGETGIRIAEKLKPDRTVAVTVVVVSAIIVIAAMIINPAVAPAVAVECVKVIKGVAALAAL